MAELLKDAKVMKFDGSKSEPIDAGKHLAGKVVGLYFSAHWCPPCRQFTPILKDFYEEVNRDDFEIVFVTFDRSAEDEQEYLKESHGAWCYIPFGAQEIEKLSKKYEVQGIPALVIIKPNGDVITARGVPDIKSPSGEPNQVVEQWKKNIV